MADLFSHRHYVFLAQTVRELGDTASPKYVRAFAKDLADALERKNPGFKRETFIRACELPPEEPN